MNTLSQEKQTQVLSLLVEGASVRSIERVTGVHRDTIVRLLARAGDVCARVMDEKLTDLKCDEIEVDEVWGYVAKKQKNVTAYDNPREVGDQYVFVALDANSKLVCSYLVGKRNGENAVHLMRDLEYRMAKRITITTDGFVPYVEAIEKWFGDNADFSQLVKVYSGDERARERYSPSGGVLNSVCEAVARLFHGGGRRLRRTTDAVGKSIVNHITVAAA